MTISDQAKKIIGTKYLTYAEKRNIALPFSKYTVKRVKDIYVYLSALHLRLKGAPNPKWVNHHNDLGLDNCLGYHFWNAVSASKKPWVTTLELPCREESRLKFLAKPECRKIFCLSSWVMNFEKSFLESNPYKDDILPKLELLPPPQEPYVEETEVLNKTIEEPFRFIFVGRDIFRKGGYETIKAFARILEKQDNIELIVVSGLGTRDYPINALPEENKHLLELIERNQANIKVYKELPHQQVMELIKSCHIGLLPSYNDSYGYSVLEFFSCGVPAITTPIYALAEINNSERGWILDLPLIDKEYGSKGVRDRASLENRKELSDTLTDLIYHQIESLLASPQETSEIIRKKGQVALQYIIDNHSPEKNVKRLEKIYDSFH